MLSINNCKDFSSVLQVFETPNVKNEVDNSMTLLVLNIDVDEPCDKLKSKELLQLSNKCKNKAIIIHFSKRNENNFAIHWKSKDLPKFLSFLPEDEASITNENIFYKFIREFLLESLKNGSLGKLDVC